MKRSSVPPPVAALVVAAIIAAAQSAGPRISLEPSRRTSSDSASPQARDRPPPPRGSQLYSVLCATCHGDEGRGDGPGAAFCAVPPADFTRGEFKVRSTASGSLPTEADLIEVIRRGAGGDGAMPAFAFLADADLTLVAAELQRFSPRWTRERPSAPPPRPPAAGDAARGAAVYRRWGCDVCHGASGRGNGRLASSLRHARGFADPPTDLTRPWRFRAAADPESLARSIVTGFNGTAMPAYQVPHGREGDLWDLASYLRSLQQQTPSFPPASPDTGSLAGYWQRPAAARIQDLSAASCASCHPLQFKDWSRSRHAAAIGPGLWAQLRERPELAPSCARCHAPLDRQPSDPYLLADGVGCSACHVRAHQVFGPPPTPATLVPFVTGAAAPHGRVNVRTFFEQSDFCGSCHQFARGEAQLVHGTALQNTIEEWKRSRAAREGRTCQTCHMPDRRHYFRGIHDPETVRAALGWSFDARSAGGRVAARMTLTNVGVGHAFPTYVVPQVWMRIELVDDRGAIRGSSERLVARTVSFAAGEWSQVADTRLFPDQTATLTYDGPIPPGVRTAIGQVIVLPDAWHAESFRDRLSKAQPGEARRYYAAALDEVQKTGYTLFRLERSLNPASH